jgi:integrase
MALQLTLRNNVWQVTGSVTLPTGERRRVRRSTGYTKHQKNYASAVLSRILDEAMSESARPSANGVTVGNVVDLYVRRPGGVGATNETVLNRFARHFGDKAVANVTVGDILLYVQGRGNSTSTVAREITCINAAFAYARENGLDVPASLKVKRPTVDDSRTRWLEASERDALIAACDDRIAPLVTFLFFTGARLGEAFSLTWGDVASGSVYLTTKKGRAKAKRTRSVPLTPRAAAAVGERPAGGSKDDLVFPAERGGKWLRQHFYPHWHRACREAGIRDFRPHDCRHTFASLLVQRGVGLRQVADLLGHTQLTMVMRYSHMAPAHLQDAVNHLELAG